MIRDLKSQSTPEAVHPGSRGWTGWRLPVIGLALIAVVGLVGFMYVKFQLRRTASTVSAEVVFTDPMWAMHADMQGMGGMMGGAISTQSAAPEAGTPLAEMAVRYFDFGALSGSQEVSHGFVLANRGDAPLIVTHAYATCGCTNAKISAAVIPPGKAGLVTVFFTPMMSTGGSQAIRRGIILETNDPLNPQIEIWVQAALEQ